MPGCALSQTSGRTLKEFDGAFFSDPEQSLAMTIDLINQCQVTVSTFPGNFIDANRCDSL
jgi:hypothetical protein